MSLFALLNHLLNFVAPAVVVGIGVTLAARWVLKSRSPAPTRQMAVNAGVGVLVLLAGLALFGRDGKMATYAALVAAIATSQWLMQGGRRRA